ncbi:MAG: thiamine ABC transporter substrate binding subunit [Proteobacteria bacterium TMED61]|nr:MAG: thiamine ABC transporter substrate binding subunit [Proteobacteria bacterium TMED61]
MTCFRLLAALGAGLLVMISLPTSAATPTLTVYTYASFVSDWGPGPLIEPAFEAHCGCDLKFVGVEDGAALLGRLKLEGSRSSADVILGLDTSLVTEAQQTGLLEPHGLNLDTIDFALSWSDPVFIPYDFGYFGFVYDSEKLANPPTSLRALVNQPQGPRIIIQDPRTSTPGLGLLLWVRKIFGDNDMSAWAALSPRIVTVTKGWSEAYGLFLKGEAPMVLSYTTSPAYHRHVEQTDQYRVAMFEEGHYQQVEVAARLAHSAQPELAKDFLQFLLSDEVQAILPTSNWMLPAVHTEQALPEAFRDDELPRTSLSFEPSEVSTERRHWIKRWLTTLAR